MVQWASNCSSGTPNVPEAVSARPGERRLPTTAPQVPTTDQAPRFQDSASAQFDDRNVNGDRGLEPSGFLTTADVGADPAGVVAGKTAV